MLIADFVLLPFAWWLALSLRYGQWWPAVISSTWWFFGAIIGIGIPIFIRFGLYRAVIRYMGEQVVLTVAQGVGLTTLILSFLTLLTGTVGIPRASFFIFFSTAFLLVAGSCFVVRSYYHVVHKRTEVQERAVIYGAGEVGAQVATALAYGHKILPVAFIDDNPSLWGSTVSGIRISAPNDLPTLIQRLNIDTVLLAIPNLRRTKKFALINSLEHLSVQVRTIPEMTTLVSGCSRVDEFREIEIDELLGRDPVTPNADLLYTCIRGKAVLVTGAGGSIGSELCRQILRLAPRRLVLFELSEFALYQIEQELRRIIEKDSLSVEMLAIIGSVHDRIRIYEVLQGCKIHTLYHAAAYKHVPLVEHNLIEGIRNNAFGTKVLAEVALECEVERFVLISTDKAVRPTNVMGASKRLAELILQALAASATTTQFCMVRFGNVLGSSGSVVPLFRGQIARGGPITLTHKDIIRYFMTIPEASQLVIQAGAMAKGGDVFVLDMGNPVRIYDLACTMVRLSGLEVKDAHNPDGDIEIITTGLRPGEKLYEELLIGANAESTAHPLIMRAYETMLPWNELQDLLAALEQTCMRGDAMLARQVLSQIVTGYTPSDEIVDVVWQFKQQRCA